MGRAARKRRETIEARRTGAEPATAAASARRPAPPLPEWHRKAFLIYTAALVLAGGAALAVAPTSSQSLAALGVYVVATLAALAYKLRASGRESAGRAGMWLAVLAAALAVAAVVGQSVLQTPTGQSLAVGIGGGLLVALSGRILFPPPPPPSRRPG